MADTDLTTKADIKTLLSISSSTYDNVLDDLIEKGSLFIEKFLNREFFDEGESATELFDGGIQTLKVKKYPINSIASISLRSGNFDSPSWQDYSASGDYIIDSDTGEIHFVFTLPRGFRNIRVIYDGGFADPSTEAPADIRNACEKLVMKEFNKRKAQGISVEKIGDLSINWETHMDSNLKLLLDLNQDLVI